MSKTRPQGYMVEIHPDLIEALRKEAAAQGTTPATIIAYAIHGYIGLARDIRSQREAGRTAELMLHINGFFGWVRRIRFDGKGWMQSD